MCGFFGVVDFSSNLTENDKNEIKSGASLIKYRGPDDEAIIYKNNICIGFQRLSIIDIGAPSQPFVSNRAIMVCNGEIYNFKELRKNLIQRGYTFSTQTDTEVILHGYEEWGENFFEKLNGIFSIAIWDKRKRKLILIRDQLGVKPLHYLRIGNRVYFGSDYNSFFKQSKLKVEINNNAILSYLSFRYSIGEQTFYKDIYDVLAGNIKQFSKNDERTITYWDIPKTINKDRGEKYYLNTLDEKLFNSVERQLMSDVPLGAFISGGLDSSILLYYLLKNKTNIKAFITGFEVDGYNEFKYADMMNDQFNFKLRKLILSPEEYISNMSEVIELRGEPVSVPHEAAFLKMTRYMKKEITVVLSGEGADELFGGYGRIFRSPFDFFKHKKFNFLSSVIKNIDPLSAFGSFDKPVDHFLWRYSWFNKEDKENFINLDYFNGKLFDEYSLGYINKLFDNVKSQKNYYHNMFYLQGKIHLQNLLNRLDRMSMAASVEARVPFLDVELVEFVSQMPLKYKNKWKNNLSKIKSTFQSSETISEKNDIPKYILKKLAVGKIPDEIIWRKKMGFPVPLDNWFNKGFNEYSKELLLDNNSKIKDIVNKKGIENFLSRDKISSSYDYDGKRVWMLLNLELWMQKYFN